MATVKGHTRAAGEDKVTNVVLFARCDDVVSRQLVDRIVVIPRSPHASNRRSVHDRVDVNNRFSCECFVRQITTNVPHPMRHQIGVLATRYADDLVAAIEQLPHDLAAKEAATACYKYLHYLPLYHITDPQRRERQRQFPQSHRNAQK